MFGAIAGALASGGISAGLNYFSAKQQNDMAQASANRSMEFSAAQSAEQMAFQERMSNTSHQREVADLKAAGLNPLLSLNSGASTPGGAMGSGSAAPVVPELGGIVSGARDAINMITQWNNSEAASDAARASAGKTRFEHRLLREDEPVRRTKGKVWNFLGKIADRFGGWSAKSAKDDWTGNLGVTPEWDKMMSEEMYGGERMQEQNFWSPRFWD